jgi:4Fe-4S ferredoxin
MLSVVEKQSFPSLVRDIKANPIKFPVDSQTTKDSCPLGLITVSYSTADGKPIENPRTLNEPERSWYKTTVKIDKDHCPCCTVCEAKLPDGTIYVRKFLNGKLTINTAKCPDGCKDCLDVCPITGTLYLSNDNKKVHLDETFCVYCGACKIVCPVNDALELKRTRIIHSPIRSGAWNKALERLTSPTDLTKELKMKGSQKAREAVRKRMVREVQ